MSVTVEKVTILLVLTKQVLCTIDGLSYMDPIRQRDLKNLNDPCKPLYWYPKNIPDYCYQKTTEKPLAPKPVAPIPLPIPVPMPPPMPVMPAYQPMMPQAPMYPPPMYPPPMFPPPPMYPGPPQGMLPASPPVPAYPSLPFGVPLAPASPMLPVAGLPYAAPYASPLYAQPPPSPWAGMVPGLPGLVTSYGGVNIMPFSDAYSDMFERHKNKMLRKKLRKLIDKCKRDYKSCH